MELPPLHQLRLESRSVPIGAPGFNGVTQKPAAGSSSASAGKGKIETSTARGKLLLEEIASKLIDFKETEKDNPKKLVGATWREAWRAALEASMDQKMKRFSKEFQKSNGRVLDEQNRILAFAKEARMNFGNNRAKEDVMCGMGMSKEEQRKFLEATGACIIEPEEKDDPDFEGQGDRKRKKDSKDASPASSSESTDDESKRKLRSKPKLNYNETPTRDSGSNPTPSNWEVAEKIYDTWQTLVAARTAFQEIAKAAKKRKEKIAGTNVNKQAEELSEAITELVADFSNLTPLLESVSELIMGFINYPLVTQNSMLNIVLMGNAGTGKTRLAEKLASVLGKLGLFVYEDFAPAGRGDFVAEYEGQTAPKTKRFLYSNLERVVFLDEAYSLTAYDADDKPTPVAAEAVAEMIKVLSDWPGSTCLIAAGYKEEMQEQFLPFNPGLTRRFLLQVELPDYTVDELETIYLKSLATAMSSDKGTVDTWFTPDAQMYFKNTLWYIKYRKSYILAQTLEDGRQQFREVYEYHNLHEFVKAQAGAMVIMANVTAQKIASASNQKELGVVWKIGAKDVYYLFQQILENTTGLAAVRIVDQELDKITMDQLKKGTKFSDSDWEGVDGDKNKGIITLGHAPKPIKDMDGGPAYLREEEARRQRKLEEAPGKGVDKQTLRSILEVIENAGKAAMKGRGVRAAQDAPPESQRIAAASQPSSGAADALAAALAKRERK